MDNSNIDKLVETEVVASDYGKNWVKILVVKKDSDKHQIKELEVCTALTLDNNHRDFMYDDNHDVIATDSQKNVVHVLAKQYGVKTIEDFGLLLCRHFLQKYPQVAVTKFTITEYPWKRMLVGGEKHVHAFHFIQDCARVCEVTQKRNESAQVCAGIRDLRVMKTTQSAFRDFVDDEYRTLPYVEDRIFSSVVTTSWWYNTTSGFCFDKTWADMKTCILETFAGPADKGVFSASVQNTLYASVKTALARIPQVEKVDVTLPNKHYFGVDFSRFPKLEFGSCNNYVYMALDKPSGNIHCVIQRKEQSKL